MSLLSRLNTRLKSNNDTGFSNTTDGIGGRFINKDGSFNVIKEGASITERVSLYYNMLTMPLGKFLLIILISFIGINLIFTILYLLLGTNELTGMISSNLTDHFNIHAIDFSVAWVSDAVVRGSRFGNCTTVRPEVACR